MNPDCKDKIEPKLVAAIESGASTPMTARDWKRIKAEASKRLRAAWGSIPPKC
jgi:hypothetical protein